jgi:cyanocobalamin reductase (cyanide-eliminating) / alkylcobalamin dealkylase
MLRTWQPLVEELQARCLPAGLDLVRAFRVDWYNRVVDPAFTLPDLGRPHALGLLIANTRALWPRFLEALRGDPARLDDEHPLDRYVMESVLGALEPLRERLEPRFDHDPPPRRVAMQRLADVAGLAHLSASGLCVHAEYGPWIALRAAVVLDVDGPAGDGRPAPDPCTGCETRCAPMLAEAAKPGSNWRSWLAVRDACPVGRTHRYGEEQIRYHYTKDRDILRRLIAAGGARERSPGDLASSGGDGDRRGARHAPLACRREPRVRPSAGGGIQAARDALRDPREGPAERRGLRSTLAARERSAASSTATSPGR